MFDIFDRNTNGIEDSLQEFIDTSVLVVIADLVKLIVLTTVLSPQHESQGIEYFCLFRWLLIAIPLGDFFLSECVGYASLSGLHFAEFSNLPELFGGKVFIVPSWLDDFRHQQSNYIWKAYYSKNAKSIFKKGKALFEYFKVTYTPKAGKYCFIINSVI